MTNCENCATECVKIEEKETPVSVPYVVYESAQARNERNAKRLVIALIVAVALIFASNAIWLWAWMQYDYVSYEVSADGDSDANYIGNDGNIYNGSTDTSEETNKEKPQG